MPKANIDFAFAATAGCQPGRAKTDWYDSTVTGFVLECRSTGGKTWYLRYQDAAGRQRQYKIGRYEDVSFSAARKKAVQLRSEVVMGGDPGAKKAEARAIPLFADIAARHLAYAKHLKSYDDIESCHRVHLSKWAKVRVTDITRTAVAQWLADKRAAGLSPATVEKLRIVLGRAFELAAQDGVPGCDKNPTRGLGKRLNNARERFLTPAEAARLRAAVAESQNPMLAPIVELLLLTGARLRELLDARWEHVSVERQAWLIPTSKTGRSRHVPLSKAALATIQALPRFGTCPWLVPNPETRKPFVSIRHAWERAIRVARLPGLRIHDLRHSAASFMVNSGVDLFAVGKVLGHASYQSTQRYAHLANDTLLAAVEAGAAKQAG